MVSFPPSSHVQPSSPEKKNSPLIDDKTKRKWQELGLNDQWLKNFPQDVNFLVNSRLIYSILGFQNSTRDGPKQNEIKVQVLPGSQKKALWIKKEGQWTPVSQIRQELRWDPKVHAVVSKHCNFKQWSYFSDQGLVPVSTTYDKEMAHQADYQPEEQIKMHAVAQLSKEEMEELLTHAQSFHATSQETLPEDSQITCAIQLITHPPSTDRQSVLQNFHAQMRAHYGVRLVMSNGDVYSFGFGVDQKQQQLKNKGLQCAVTMNGQPKNLDYMEFQKYDQRLVTTVPLDEIQAAEILRHLNCYRAEGIRFNILKQNCVRFATHLLHLAGISVNTRVSLLTTAWRSLPNVEHLPLIGTPLGKVNESVQKVYQQVAAKIPAVVKEIFAYLTAVVFYIPNQMMIFILNVGLWAVGGTTSSTNTSLELEKNEEAGQLENFETLVSGFFDSRSTDVYHSSILIHWQLSQKSTEVYHYSEQPSMNILPPKTSEDKDFSNQKKADLKVIYQESKETKG